MTWAFVSLYIAGVIAFWFIGGWRAAAHPAGTQERFNVGANWCCAGVAWPFVSVVCILALIPAAFISVGIKARERIGA